MESKLTIPIILGTTRENSNSAIVAHAVLDIANQITGIDWVLVDPRDPKYQITGEHTGTAEYGDLIKKADGFVIITPEYNHSIPGSLKSLLDAEFKSYAFKPAILMGVSDGMMGGSRAIEALLHVLKALNIYAINKDTYFPRAQDMFDDKGKLLDPEMPARITERLELLAKVAHVMRALRAE